MRIHSLVAGAVLSCSVVLSTPALAAAEPANQSVPAEQIVIPAPPQGMGQVVFFRKGGFVGAAVACSVHENGQKVSSLSGGRYFVMATAPGRHEFSVKTEATDSLALEVEEGETQFASCKIKMGIMVGRPDIRPATEAEFRAAGGFKMVDADDMGPGPGARRPDEIAATLAAPPAPVATPATTDQPAATEQPAAPPSSGQ